jgi:hypothetical protein
MGILREWEYVDLSVVLPILILIKIIISNERLKERKTEKLRAEEHKVRLTFSSNVIYKIGAAERTDMRKMMTTSK